MPTPRPIYPTIAESEECRQILDIMAQAETPRASTEVLAKFEKVLGKRYCRDAGVKALQRCGCTYHRMRFAGGSRRQVWLPPLGA